MAPRKPSLTAALHEASGTKRNTAAEETPTQETNSSEPTSRQGKKIISGHFDPAVSRQLKQIALNNDSTIQELLREALNDLFVKYNQNPLA